MALSAGMQRACAEQRGSCQHSMKKSPGPVCIRPCKHLGGPGKDGKEGARETREYMGGQELCGRETVRLSVSTIRK